MDLSVVVPLYNEQESVGPLYESIKKSVTEITDKYEILFIGVGPVIVLVGYLSSHCAL